MAFLKDLSLGIGQRMERQIPVLISFSVSCGSPKRELLGCIGVGRESLWVRRVFLFVFNVVCFCLLVWKLLLLLVSFVCLLFISKALYNQYY